MRIVVDTNIVFSAILNTQSKIAHILISGSKYFDFYSIYLLKEELKNNKNKILKISGYSISQYEEVYHEIISKITFVNDILLLDSEIDTALNLTKDIDESDTLFVALANQLKSKIWTGDKKLFLGLRDKAYDNILTTESIYELFIEYQYDRR